MRRRTVIGAGFAALAAAQQAPLLTAEAVIERIKKNLGIPWRAQTVDRIIAGAPETPVKGIATTMMATLDVLQRASKAGLNLVITHEPTFYSHQDSVEQLTSDPTYQFKLDFIRRNNMAVFHFHDHWHARSPDGIAAGMTRELGWEKNADPQNPRLFSFEPTSLAALVSDMQRKLGASSIRVVGDPRMTVRRAIASWGYASQFPGIPLLARADVDVLIVGETREWEVVEYAQDMIASGKHKALIVLGHVVSEQAGMKLCAEWLKGFITEVPVDLVPAAEPFWIPPSTTRPGKG